MRDGWSERATMAGLLGWALAAGMTAVGGAQRKPVRQPPDQGQKPPAPVIVSKVEVKFHTNDDDKDTDTKLVTDFACRDSIFASSSLGWADAGGRVVSPPLFGFLGGSSKDAFSDNSETKWMAVTVSNTVAKATIHGCTTTVRIDPNGNDTWRFNYWVRLTYSDGTHDEYHYDGHALSQKVRSNTFGLN